MTLQRTLLGIFLALILPIWAAHADWEGVIRVKMTGSSPSEVNGTMRMKKNQIRVDTKTPMDISTLIDLKKHKVWTLVNAPRLVMDADFSKIEGKAPLCGADNIDSCLAKQGFKKTGSETLDGHECTIYEGSVSSGSQKTEVKLWRPNDLKEVPSIKSVAKEKSGNTIETFVTQIHVKPQDDSYFALPKDYRSMGNMSDIMNSVKAFQLNK